MTEPIGEDEEVPIPVPSKPLSGGGGDGMPSWRDFMAQQGDEPPPAPAPRTTRYPTPNLRVVKKKVVVKKAAPALDPEEEEKKRYS